MLKRKCDQYEVLIKEKLEGHCDVTLAHRCVKILKAMITSETCVSITAFLLNYILVLIDDLPLNTNPPGKDIFLTQTSKLVIHPPISIHTTHTSCIHTVNACMHTHVEYTHTHTCVQEHNQK